MLNPNLIPRIFLTAFQDGSKWAWYVRDIIVAPLAGQKFTD